MRMNQDERSKKRPLIEFPSGQRPKKQPRTELPSGNASYHRATVPDQVHPVHIIPQNARSLRISGIHSSVPYEEFRSFLEGLDAPVSVHNDNVLALSLAPDTSDSKQVATVCFKHEPDFIAKCTPGVSVEMKYSDGKTESRLVVDCEFFGLTPLYTAPEPIVE